MNSPETRHSLLFRVRDASDDEAWAEFAAIYRPVICCFAVFRGLQEADAEEQELSTIEATPASEFWDGSWLSWIGGGIGSFFGGIYDGLTWAADFAVAFAGEYNHYGYWTDWMSDPTTILGQLVTGDILGNQIWELMAMLRSDRLRS